MQKYKDVTKVTVITHFQHQLVFGRLQTEEKLFVPPGVQSLFLGLGEDRVYHLVTMAGHLHIHVRAYRSTPKPQIVHLPE